LPEGNAAADPQAANAEVDQEYLNQRMMNVQTWHEFSMFSYSYA
jgi:hypothetical protein